MTRNSGRPWRNCAKRSSSRCRSWSSGPAFSAPAHLFPTWGATFLVEVDKELVDKEQLGNWLDIAGRRIGIGDWRPGKSGGLYGRFETVDIKEI